MVSGRLWVQNEIPDIFSFLVSINFTVPGSSPINAASIKIIKSGAIDFTSPKIFSGALPPFKNLN